MEVSENWRKRSELKVEEKDRRHAEEVEEEEKLKK